MTSLVPLPRLLAAAAASDSRRRAGDSAVLSPFDGIPVVVKGNIALRHSTGFDAASAMLRVKTKDDTCPYDADCVSSLKSAGFIPIGHSNMDEFGMGSSTTHSCHGPTYNPDHFPGKNKTIGGSSGGSAAAVVAGLVPVALGTDTGGSVRLPAAYGGIPGFKPTYGRISRRGIVAYASSLDTVGILGSSVGCLRTIYDIIKVGKNDTVEDSTVTSSTWEQDDVPRLSQRKLWREVYHNGKIPRPTLAGLRVGAPAALSVVECPPCVRDAWKRSIRALAEVGGATIHPVLAPDGTDSPAPSLVRSCLAAYYVLACAEAASNLARYDGVQYGGNNGGQYEAVRTSEFGEEAICRILAGNAVLSAGMFHEQYGAACSIREELRRQFRAAFGAVDLIVCPTVLHPPHEIIEDDKNASDKTEALGRDIMTVPASLAGLPAVSVPVKIEMNGSKEDAEWESSGAKVCGIQIIGPALCDEMVLEAAEVLESWQNQSGKWTERTE